MRMPINWQIKNGNKNKLRLIKYNLTQQDNNDIFFKC